VRMRGVAAMTVLDSNTTAQVSRSSSRVLVITDVESSDMEVVVELGVPGASEGVAGSDGGRLIRVGGAVDMVCGVYADVYMSRYEKEPWVGDLVLIENCLV
jgi:hypothetical protein